jgi:glycosyltransferase involved in cell wall biosynthesis
MKILLTIHEHLNPNTGASGSTLKLGREYIEMGHQVFFYSFDDLPNYLPYIAKEVLFPEFVAAHISKLMEVNGLDVIDSSTGDIWFWAKNFSKPKHKSTLLVTRSHGLENLWHLQLLEDVRLNQIKLSWKYFLYRGSIQLWEVQNSLHYSDLVYLLNTQEKKYSIEQLGIQTEKIKVLANGIPERFLNLPFKYATQNTDSVIRIAQIGTYIPRKGIQYGKYAINNILSRYPQVEIGFFGTKCKECPNAEQIYADFNPEFWNRITVIPSYEHENLPSLLQDYHIKLFPTLREGFSLALVEAMACGLAPVTTFHPAALEVVRDAYNGMIVPFRDSIAIEKALEKLIKEGNYLETLRRNAYFTAQEYSWKTIAQNTLSFYQNALSQKRG